jgi:hypothetical protein
MLLGGIMASAAAQSSTDWRQFWPTSGEGFSEGLLVRVDSQGNTVVAGTTPVDDEEYTVVQKYSPSGNLLWSTTYDAEGLTCSCPTDMQLDENDNVIITGHVEHLDTSTISWLTIKCNSAGVFQWANVDLTGEAEALQVGAGGYVYVTGYAENGVSDDIVLRKIHPNGNTVWTKYWGGPSDSNDFATDLGIDDSGNLYIGAFSMGSSTGPAYVQRVIKYASNGARPWVKTYALANLDVTAVRVIGKPDGGCYVASQAINGSDGSTAYGVVSSYGGDGTILWRRTINVNPTGSDEMIDMGLDGNGNITALIELDSGTNYDIFLRRFDSSGAVLWSKKYAPAGGLDDHPKALGVTADGITYVVGNAIQSDGSWQSLTLKYSNAGTRLWDSLYGSVQGYATGVDVAIDGGKAVGIGSNQTTDTRWAMMIWKIE